MFFEEGREHLHLLLSLLVLQLHQFSVELHEVPVDGFFRLQFFQSLEEARDAFFTGNFGVIFVVV